MVRSRAQRGVSNHSRRPARAGLLRMRKLLLNRSKSLCKGTWGAVSNISGPASAVGLEHVAGDDHLHDFARALGDAVAALLAPQLLDPQIGGEPDAAVDLHALVCRAAR